MEQAQPPVAYVQSFQGTIRPFDTTDVLTWFQHFESVLRIHHVEDAQKYDHLMAVLTKNAIAPIAMQLKRTPDDEATRYAWLKELLVDGHGKSNKERLRQLLAGEKIGDRRPSQFLSRLHEVAPEGVDSEIIHEMWWKELPSASRAILTTMRDAPADELAKVADAVHQELATAQIHAVREPAPQLDELKELRAMMQRLGDEMYDLRHQLTQMNRSRRQTTHQRSDSVPRAAVRARSRSTSRQRQPPAMPKPNQPQGEDTVCYYHRQYADQARNCRPPCTHQKN